MVRRGVTGSKIYDGVQIEVGRGYAGVQRPSSVIF